MSDNKNHKKMVFVSFTDSRYHYTETSNALIDLIYWGKITYHKSLCSYDSAVLQGGLL